MMKNCGPSPKGEAYCECGCGAYDGERCGRADCPHGELCRLMARGVADARAAEVKRYLAGLPDGRDYARSEDASMSEGAFDEVHALRAEVAKVRQDYHDAAGELLVDIGDAQPGTLVAKLLTANRIMARERDALRAERDALRVLVETLGRMGTRLKAETERDALKAAARALLDVLFEDDISVYVVGNKAKALEKLL